MCNGLGEEGHWRLANSIAFSSLHHSEQAGEQWQMRLEKWTGLEGSEPALLWSFTLFCTLQPGISLNTQSLFKK